MANTRNTRVLSLLKTLGIDLMEASTRIGKQPATLYRIANNEVEASKATLKIIAEKFGANYDWLLTGKGEMLDKNPKKAVSVADDSLELLREQLAKKDALIERLAVSVDRLTEKLMSAEVRFRKPSTKAEATIIPIQQLRLFSPVEGLTGTDN